MDDPTIKKLALIIAANCIKDSTVEKIRSSLSDEEQKKFHQLISNRIYTFLLYLLTKPAQEYVIFMEELAKNYPNDWPAPELDSTFTQFVKHSVQSSSSDIPMP